MGVPTSEVGYTSAMPRREDHEVHKDMWGIAKKILGDMFRPYNGHPQANLGQGTVKIVIHWDSIVCIRTWYIVEFLVMNKTLKQCGKMINIPNVLRCMLLVFLTYRIIFIT